MFSFPPQQKKQNVRNQLRRIADLSSPNFAPSSGDLRAADRQNRTIPVLLMPYERAVPVIEEATTAVTKDISDQGLAVLLHQPYRGGEVVVGMWIANTPLEEAFLEPSFFLGAVRQCVEIGGGYWHLGVELSEVLDCPYQVTELQPLAQRLLSRAARRRMQELRSQATPLGV